MSQSNSQVCFFSVLHDSGLLPDVSKCIISMAICIEQHFIKDVRSYVVRHFEIGELDKDKIVSFLKLHREFF